MLKEERCAVISQQLKMPLSIQPARHLQNIQQLNMPPAEQ